MAYDRNAAGQVCGGITSRSLQGENSLLADTKADRNPQVAEALLSVEARLQDLNAVVTRLEQRLSVAMRPVGPSDVSDKQTEHPVQLVSAINRFRRGSVTSPTDCVTLWTDWRFDYGCKVARYASS